jgi:hypothetical protein
MPKTKGRGKTVKFGVKGNRINRGGPTVAAATSFGKSVNSVVTKPLKRPRSKRINKGGPTISMASSMASGMSSIGKSAYDMGMPMALSAADSVGQSVYKFISDQKVPTVPPAWVDFKSALTQALINIGTLEDDDNIDPAIYFQSVREFLDTHKGVINSELINKKKMTFAGIDPENPGDATPKIMEGIFKDGVTKESIIAALEYGFPSEDYIDIEPEPEPGQGFQGAREKTVKKQKMTKLLHLSSEIERLLTEINSESKHEKNMTPTEIYDIKLKKKQDEQKMNDYFKELQDLITTDEEFKVLQRLVEQNSQLNSMMPSALKKKMKGKKKRSSHKRRKRKRTGRR